MDCILNIIGFVLDSYTSCKQLVEGNPSLKDVIHVLNLLMDLYVLCMS